MKKFITILFLTILSFAAMALDGTQRTALGVAVNAEPSVATCITAGDDTCVASWLNSPSSFIVWKSKVTKDEYQTLTGPTTATTFDWSGTGGYISRSAAEKSAWDTIFSSTGSVNPSRANVRAAFADIFSGAGAGAVSNRNLLADLSKRNATQAEKVLGSGTGTLVTPGNLTFEGTVPLNEIGPILGR